MFLEGPMDGRRAIAQIQKGFGCIHRDELLQSLWLLFHSLL